MVAVSSGGLATDFEGCFRLGLRCVQFFATEEVCNSSLVLEAEVLLLLEWKRVNVLLLTMVDHFCASVLVERV